MQVGLPIIHHEKGRHYPLLDHKKEDISVPKQVETQDIQIIRILLKSYCFHAKSSVKFMDITFGGWGVFNHSFR
jgi:hypothetical protein